MLLIKLCVSSVVTLVKYPDGQPPEHQAKISHELIGGAAAFAVCRHLFSFLALLMNIFQAAKAYEKHCAENGKPVSHAKAKELLYILFCVC